MVMEAVAIKAKKEDEKAQKEAEEQKKRDEFKTDFSELEAYRSAPTT